MKGPVIVLSIIITIFLLVDLYAFKGVKLLTGNLENKQLIKWIYWSFSALAIVLIITLFFQLNYAEDRHSYKLPFYSAGFLIIYFVPKLIFVIFHLVEDIGFLGYKGVKSIIVKPEHSGEIINRAKFLTQIGAGLATLQFMALFYGVAKGRYRFSVKHQPLEFDNLPDGFNGIRIVHISDTHIGSFFDNHEPVEKGIKMINELNADYIFFTGDMVNNYAWELDGWMDILSGMKASYGKYAILGNHDYGDYVKWDSLEDKAKNFNKLIELERQMGFTVLLNESVTLRHNSDEIELLGVQNWGKGGFSRYGNLAQTMRNTKKDSFKILMSHDPSHWDAEVLSHTEIDLTLSGHTHGMQYGVEIGGFQWSPVKYRYPRWAGLYQENKQYLYVNRGFGYIGFPGRVGIYPEITLLELKGISKKK